MSKMIEKPVPSCIDEDELRELRKQAALRREITAEVERQMGLVEISETRRPERTHRGVRDFFSRAERNRHDIHLSVVTVAELRQGVHRLRHKGDAKQAATLEAWVNDVLQAYKQRILPVNKEIGKVWGRLRVPHAEPALDKLIAATALIHDLTVVTRNVRDFEIVGVKTLNPFE